MRIYRCFHDANFPTGARIVLDESEAQHLGSVRRAEVGDQVHLFNGRGVECAATIEEARKKSVTLLVGAPLRQQPTPTRRTVLAVAITKGSDYDDMLQRSIELGVTDFQPLLTDRTIVELDPFKIQKRLERWQRISIEALKQCERLWLPVLEPPLPLDEYLRQGSAPTRIVLRERAGSIPPLAELLHNHRADSVAMLIGPEGGWSPADIEEIEAAGCLPATLGGDAILRTETAALAALALRGATN